MSRHQFLKSFFCSFIIFLLDISHGTVHHHLPVFATEFQTFRIVCNRPIVVFLTLPGNTTGIISLRQERIPFETSRTIVFRPLEIVEADFRHRPIEIRLGQPRLRFDYLIKILNGKHIVLEIQGITPDRHHPVRINLCEQRYGPHLNQHQQKQLLHHSLFLNLFLFEGQM